MQNETLVNARAIAASSKIGNIERLSNAHPDSLSHHRQAKKLAAFHFIPWNPDADVCGEAAGMSCDGRFVDLVVTYCADGRFCWDVIDDSRADKRLAFGTASSAAEARRAAEIAGSRAFIHAV